MALTLTKVYANDVANKRVRVYDVTFDSSYATGGEALVPSDVGLKVVQHATVGVGNVSTTFYHSLYDIANQKMLTITAGAQTASTTDLSALTVRVRFEGY